MAATANVSTCAISTISLILLLGGRSFLRLLFLKRAEDKLQALENKRAIEQIFMVEDSSNKVIRQRQCVTRDELALNRERECLQFLFKHIAGYLQMIHLHTHLGIQQ